MFQGKETVRFCSDLPETAVVQKVRETLGGLGRVAIDRSGGIAIEPKEEFRSFLAETAVGGRLRRELNEYDVRIDYVCKPSAAGWVIIVVGTLPLLLGWAAVLAPLSVRKRVGEAVRGALGRAAEDLGGATARRFGRKSGDRRH